MTLKQFLDSYDLQEGDIVEMDTGGKFICSKGNLLGPLPKLYFSMEKECAHIFQSSKPFRVLRPNWECFGYNGTFGSDSRQLHLKILEPQPSLECKPTILIDGKKYRLVEE